MALLKGMNPLVSVHPWSWPTLDTTPYNHWVLQCHEKEQYTCLDLEAERLRVIWGPWWGSGRELDWTIRDGWVSDGKQAPKMFRRGCVGCSGADEEA